MKKSPKSDVVPLDLLIEVLAETVCKFQLVSKSWEKIIRSKTFIRSFPFRSLTEPLRLLIALNVKDGKTGERSCCFFSTCSLSSSSTSISTSLLSRITCTPKKKHRVRLDSPNYYVNGLMLVGGIIINPCTGKSITVPNVETGRSTQVKLFFGYEPVNDEYKVLRMTGKLKARLADPWSDFQVFTLGTNNKQESWRPIDCSFPYSPRSKGLCIDGAVYYIAHTGTGKNLSVVRFDLKSEKFDIFARVSEGLLAHRKVPTLINYHGKVATAIQHHSFESIPWQSSLSRIDLFVFEAGKQDFKERSFHINSLPWPWTYSLHMKGINHMGEIIFADYDSKEARVILYDLKGDNWKIIKIEVDASPDGGRFSERNYFVGYLQSLMLL